VVAGGGIGCFNSSPKPSCSGICVMPDAHADGVADAASDADVGMDDGDLAVNDGKGATDARSDMSIGVQVMPDAALPDAIPHDFFSGIQVMPDSGIDPHPVTADGGSDATQVGVRVLSGGGPQPAPELPRNWLDAARA
jgi:hypothetical protein